jgi:hypothetical protein
VTGRQEGLVVIRATYEDVTGSRTITVAPPELRLSGRTELTQRGETSQLGLTAIRADGSREEVRVAAAEWTSSNPAVATVNATGIVTATASGRSDIAALYEGATARVTVFVNIAPPRLIIDAPLNNPDGLTVTFEWRLLDPDPARTYRFEVRLDKGVDACDSHIEQAFSAGTATRLTVTLDAGRYRGQSASFAIRAEDGQGFSTCVRGPVLTFR